MNPFLQLAAEKKDSKKGAARKFFGPSYFDPTLVNLTSKFDGYNCLVNTWTDLLEPVFKENHFQIWTGDFNALTREDYTNEQWNHITGVRKQNGWELPKTELTTQVSAVNS